LDREDTDVHENNVCRTSRNVEMFGFNSSCYIANSNRPLLLKSFSCVGWGPRVLLCWSL